VTALCANCGRPLPAPAAACPSCTLPAADADEAPDAGGGAPLAPAGLVAERYLLQRRLGRGGAKDVWLAHDLTLDRDVALARVSGPSAWPRLRREARLTARLGGHRHIVTVHDVFEDAGRPCLVARYMTGGSLADRLARATGGRLRPQDAIRAGAEVADALAHAHAHGVVHRDVKPDNVWIDAQGEAALGDFGIALAERGEDEPQRRGEGTPGAVGTPLYSAPEQAAGETPTPASDLYALGVTLYELLSGRPPFRATQLLRRPLPPAPSTLAGGVPEALDRLVLDLLAPDPADRPESARAVALRLRGLLDDGRDVVPAPGVARVFGRASELRLLREALARAWQGTIGLALVRGEPGIGKTTLLEALATQARASGGLVLQGRGELESPPFGLWRPVVGTLAANAQGAGDPRRVLAAAIAGDGDQLQLFRAVADVLEAAAAARPLLVVLDDLQWADPSSLRLLTYLAGLGSVARVLLAGGVRSDEPPAPLRELAGRSDVEQVALRGISLDAVRELLPTDVTISARTVEAIHARTDGNPLYVAELVRLLDRDGNLPDTVPPRVREAVAARVERLDAAARDVLEVGAVASRFSIAGLARVSGRPRPQVAEALETAGQAGLIVPEGSGRFAFAHPIVRDAIHAGLTPARRARLHVAVAEALLARRDAGAEIAAAEVAHHLIVAARAGADPQPVWSAALEAAREASATLAYADAAGQYANALEALELGAEVPAPERLAALLAYAEATFASGDIEAGRRRFEQAAAAASRAGSAAILARAALGFSQVQQYGSFDERAVELLTQALAALAPEPGELRARVTGMLASRLAPATDQRRRERLIDEAVAMARELDDTRTLRGLQAFAVKINWRPERAAQRVAAGEEVVRLAAPAADHGAVLWAYVQRIRDELMAGDVLAAGADIDRARPVAHASRRSYDRWYLLVVEACWATLRGRLDEGARLASEALALNRQHGADCEQESTIQRLLLARLRWRPHDADLTLLREFASRYAALPVWEAMLAALEWDLGRPRAALRGLAACAHDGFAAVSHSQDGLAALALLAEVAAGTGVHVGELHELLAPHADRNPVVDDAVAAWGPVARPLGLLAAADGRPEDAAAHFARALELAERWDAPAWALRTIGDWLWTAVPADRTALLGRGLVLARELQLPRAAASLSDAAQPGVADRPR